MTKEVNVTELREALHIAGVVCSYLILDKTNKVVAEKATLKEAKMYVKVRPYLKYEKFEIPSESVACDLDGIL